MGRRKSGGKRMTNIVEGGKNTITLSTGVVLRVQAVPAWKLNELSLQIVRPDIPKITVDGDRVEENPQDPEYLKAMQRYEQEMSEKMNEYFIVFGTEIETIPESFQKLEDKIWKEKLQWSGTEIGEGAIAVYLAWVKYIAAPTMDDIRIIISEVGRRSGVSEVDVQTAAKNFRS
jgi:hypothetical protein